MDRGVTVFSEFDAARERLVRQTLALVVGACVHGGAIDQEAQRSREVASCAFTARVFLRESSVDVCEARADAVLMTLETVQIDRVSEVSGEELLAFIVEALPVAREFRDL